MNKNGSTTKLISAGLILLIISAVLAVISIYPVDNNNEKNSLLLHNSLNLTSKEMYKLALGNFRGGEKVTVVFEEINNNPISFSIFTFNEVIHSGFSSNANYSFVAEPGYHELDFTNGSVRVAELTIDIFVQKSEFSYPYLGLSTLAKIMFLSSGGFVVAILLRDVFRENLPRLIIKEIKLRRAHKKLLQFIVLLSLFVCLLALSQNRNSLATVGDFFTDHSRHPYSANLFLKDGFQVFSTPLGQLANYDLLSNYKFVTWPETPHIYPIGSIFLFLPFGFLLERGLPQLFVFKMEILLFLIVSHVSFYFFIKRLWPKQISIPLKLLTALVLYVSLVLYSANGMFDSIPFLFLLTAITWYLAEKYDYFFLFSIISLTIKYQVGLILLPLMIIGLMKLFAQSNFSSLIRNKALIAAGLLVTIDLYTALLSASSFLATRPEFVINGINLFNPNAQISYLLQSFAVLLTLIATLIFAIYLLRKNRFMSLVMIFTLLPIFILPFFQVWYLPYFFIYLLTPHQKRSLTLTIIWLLLIAFMLSFGPLSYDVGQVFESIKKIF
jgi:hypothetical protein